MFIMQSTPQRRMMFMALLLAALQLVAGVAGALHAAAHAADEAPVHADYGRDCAACAAVSAALPAAPGAGVATAAWSSCAPVLCAADANDHPATIHQPASRAPPHT
jgi:hypothetical protein